MKVVFKFTFLAVVPILLINSTEGLHEIYNGCRVSYGCFGTTYDSNSVDCVTNGNCKSMVKFMHDPTNEQFKMVLHHNFTPTETENYIAFGISMDDVMGDDVVFACPSEEGTGVKLTYNMGHENTPTIVFDNPQPVTGWITDVNGVAKLTHAS